jgi:hypothetical protein
MAIWVKQPWNAVRRVRLFDEEYHRVFNRKIDGTKLYVAHQINKAVLAHRHMLRDDLESSFASVRFTIVHLLAQTIRATDLGAAFLEDPSRWLPERKDEVFEVMSDLIAEVIESVNFYVESKEQEEKEPGHFDPKVVFMSHQGIRPLEHDVLRLSKRMARRSNDYGFQVPPS